MKLSEVNDAFRLASERRQLQRILQVLEEDDGETELAVNFGGWDVPFDAAQTDTIINGCIVETQRQLVAIDERLVAMGIEIDVAVAADDDDDDVEMEQAA